MTVGLNPNIKFSGYYFSDEKMEKLRKQAKNNPEMLAVLNEAKPEEFKSEQPKKKNKFKNRLASVAKFFTATEEITKGTAKGAVYGTMTGVGVMLGGWLFGALPKGFKKGNSLKAVFKNPVASISKSSKITAGLAAVGVAAYHIIRGKLMANQRNAFVDQKLNNY